MVKIENKTHFQEALTFAKTLKGKPKKSFYQCIKTLNRLKKNGYKNYDLHIYPDWVAHSFAFVFINDEENKTGITGGMILHGFQKTFSVELESKNFPHWSIHT